MKIKRSLTKEMIAAFAGILLFIMLLAIIINGIFLPKYYRNRKEKKLLSAYEEINEAIGNDAIGSESFTLSVEKYCAVANIAIYVIAPDGTVYLSSTTDVSVLKNRLLERTLSVNEDEVLEESDNYQLLRTQDTKMQTEYMEMWGHFTDGSAFIMRTPLESITESAKVANRFLLFISVGGTLLGALLVFFFSKKITRPIISLADLSSRMASLDFSARYDGGGKDEIGLLGDNFNHMSQNLEQAVSELKNANLKLTRDIQKKEELESMRSDFVSNVSHELKTPIALIQGYAEGLDDDTVLENPEDRKYYADVILDETKKMNRTIKNLLSLNQLEYGKEKAELSRFDIGEMVAGVLSANRILLKENGIAVENEVPLPLFVWGDTFLMEEVFTNYLSNAIHHCEGQKRIRITAELKENRTVIRVFNTGKPIPMEDLDRLWEKFYKVDKARTRAYGGNGIGLSIVRAIMQAHSGGYGVSNEADGVSFFFDLESSL